VTTRLSLIDEAQPIEGYCYVCADFGCRTIWCFPVSLFSLRPPADSAEYCRLGNIQTHDQGLTMVVVSSYVCCLSLWISRNVSVPLDKRTRQPSPLRILTYHFFSSYSCLFLPRLAPCRVDFHPARRLIGTPEAGCGFKILIRLQSRVYESHLHSMGKLILG
jgi:hypothetical protein